MYSKTLLPFFILFIPSCTSQLLTQELCEKEGWECNCFKVGYPEGEECEINPLGKENRFRNLRGADWVKPWSWTGLIINAGAQVQGPHSCLVDGSNRTEAGEGESISTGICVFPNEPIGKQVDELKWEVKGEIRVYNATNPIYNPIFVGTFRNLATNRCITYREKQWVRDPPKNSKTLGAITSEPCDETDYDSVQKFIVWLWKDDYHHNLVPYNEHWSPICGDPLYSGITANHPSNRGIQTEHGVAAPVTIGCGVTDWEFYPTGFFRAEGPHKNAEIPDDISSWYQDDIEARPPPENLKDVFI